MHPVRGMIGLHWEIYPFSSMLSSSHSRWIPFTSGCCWCFSKSVRCARVWGCKVTKKKRGEIQHEGKAVENVSKATERVRKGKRIERIVSCRKSCKPSSTVPRRDGGSRGETANKSQDFSFFFFSFLVLQGGSREELVKSISRSKYGTVPTLQDDCRSVQPHCRCSTTSTV